MPHPPQIPRSRVLANVPAYIRNPLGMFAGYAATHGKNFRFSVVKGRQMHVTTDADVFQHVLQKNHRNYEKSEIQTDQIARYFGQGLLTNTGKDWLKQRRAIQPGFTRVRLEELTAQMIDVIDRECGTLARAADSGARVNLHHFTRDAVFSVIARAIFTDGFTTEEVEKLHYTIEKVQGYIIYPVRLPFLRAPLRWLGQERKHVGLSLEVRDFVQGRIDARRASGEHKDDLLQMLLDIRYRDTGKGMTDEQLIDEVMILFAAGHETSANSLAWTLWLLLRHPEQLARAKAEIAAAEAEGPIDFHGVRRLPFLTQVIEESMRLYPPAWIIDRVALGADEAAGLTVDPNTIIGLYIRGLHRNPEYWEAPDEFRPERMTPEAKKARHPGAYQAFGGGPRLCIGNHFAMLEMQLFLVAVLRDYDLTLPTDADKVKESPAITLRMDRPVLVGVRRLSD